MPTLSFHKRESLARAEALIRDGGAAALRYACLELRFCMEAIAYEKLATYRSRIPQSVYRNWQPPQLFRALEQLEPNSTRDFVLRAARESTPGQPAGPWMTIGQHLTFRTRELRKLYNKVGSFLHAPMPTREPRTAPHEPESAELLDVVERLRPLAASTMDSSLATVIDFVCVVCGEVVIANAEGAVSRGRVECLNPNCGAAYHVRHSNGKVDGVDLEATTFECISCDAGTQVENRKLEIGYRFTCASCGEEHVFAERQWGYGRTRDRIEPGPDRPDGGTGGPV